MINLSTENNGAEHTNNPQEASWSGFEVEVENDALEVGDPDLNSSNHECILTNEPEIIVECLETSTNTNGEIATAAIVTSSGNIVTSNTSFKKDSKSVENDRPRTTALKRPRFGSEKGLDKGNGESSFPKVSRGTTHLDTKSDEFSAFAMYVQQEMKKITNPYALQMTKLKINQVLFEGTTGTYDRLPSGITPVKTPRSQMVITSKIQPYEPPRGSEGS